MSNPALETLTQQFERLLNEKDLILIAIDGYCTSGKTTLASTLSKLYDCNVFHMDDFFLRPEQRTEDRLREIGGNVDYERFAKEVLAPLKTGKPFSYRPYDCHTMTLMEPHQVTPKKLNIIEGTYSMHPSLAPAYDLSIFLTISPDLQRERILQRNPRLHQNFFEKWIPMENQYFEGTRLSKRCDIILNTNEQ